MKTSFVVAVALWGVTASSPAQAASGLEAPSSTWLGEEDYAGFKIQGQEYSKGEMAVASLDAPGGSKPGLRFTVREHTDAPLAIQAAVPNPRPVAAKDTLFAHFFMRTVSSELESGEGKVQFILEDAKTYDKSIQFPATAANDWKEYNLPFASKGDFAPDAARIIFRLGYRRQTVEIAGLEIRNYGSSVAASALPMTKPDLSYPGMAADAPWRIAAEARIKEFRKSALTIQVADKAGQPVPDAKVEVRQTRHAFQFGTALGAKTLLDSAEGTDHRLSDALLENFNIITFENDLKWPRLKQSRETALQAARWCQEHHIVLRGHNLVWPGWKFLPPELKELQSKPDELRHTVLQHVRDTATEFRPYAALWDVVNEPFNNHDLMDILGEKILVDIFRTAREAAPDAKLFINDYGIVSGNGVDKAHQAGFEKTIRYLLDQHAPLEGIGIQGHFGQEFTPPERIYDILDRFAKFQLPLQMTEFTTQAEDRQMDANVLRDVMTVFFSHPAVNAFIFWGFYEGKGFDHKATLYDADGQLTVVGKTYRDLVFGKWWTHEGTTTKADGSARVEGFHGKYEVTVSHGGKVATKQEVELKPGGSVLKVSLE